MSDPHTLVLTFLITGRIKVNLAAELPDVVAILKERVIAHFLNLRCELSLKPITRHD